MHFRNRERKKRERYSTQIFSSSARNVYLKIFIMVEKFALKLFFDFFLKFTFKFIFKFFIIHAHGTRFY